MQEGKFSRTAHRVALRRAAHQILDEPRIFDDPLAVRIAGAKAAQFSADQREQHPFGRAFRAFMAVRSRYAEDELGKAVGHGVTQYVVLGAGLDTFAYRNPHASLRVFEVDHPATQEWKRERLHAAGIAIPASLTFVPVDFERQTLRAGLEQSGLDFSAAAFFSWLGVTPYLTRQACMATLGLVAGMPAGSGIAFDFAVDPKLLDLKQRLALWALSARVAAAGEPFQLFFKPDELELDLKGLGFHEVEILAASQINVRYFGARTDGLRVGGSIGRLASAWV
jgi:methyltransferase (TIGR00027 family)